MKNSSPPPLTLASASPRRHELLRLLARPFSTAIPEVDETPQPEEPPRRFAERLAREKAEALQLEGTVISADTVVILNEMILGKPMDKQHAREMLCALSGNGHEVITAVCVKNEVRCEVFSVATQVVFRELTEAEIETYIASGEPMDKAGAYGIQGRAAHMVRSINGSYTNVVGLPLCELHEVLISFDSQAGIK